MSTTMAIESVFTLTVLTLNFFNDVYVTLRDCEINFNMAAKLTHFVLKQLPLAAVVLLLRNTLATVWHRNDTGECIIQYPWWTEDLSHIFCINMAFHICGDKTKFLSTQWYVLNWWDGILILKKTAPWWQLAEACRVENNRLIYQDVGDAIMGHVTLMASRRFTGSVSNMETSSITHGDKFSLLDPRSLCGKQGSLCHWTRCGRGKWPLFCRRILNAFSSIKGVAFRQISLEFVSNCPVNNKPTLTQTMNYSLV